MVDYQVRLMNMPSKVNECVTQNDDGSFTIFINDALSPMGKENAFNHAMCHIMRDDFSIHGDIQKIEWECHYEH